METWFDSSTWCFVFLLAFNLISWMRYLFTLYNWDGYIYLMNANYYVQSLLQYQVCSIFVRNSIDSQNPIYPLVNRGMKILLFAIFVVYGVLYVTECVMASQNHKILAVGCNNVFFVVSGAMNLAISLILVFLGRYVNLQSTSYLTNVRLGVVQDNKISEGLGLTSQARAEKFEVQLKEKLRKMWVIILGILICNIFSFLYSLILILNYEEVDGACQVSNSTFIYNFTRLTERFTQFVFWEIPIIFVFWPADRTWFFTQKQQQEPYRSYENIRQFSPENVGVQKQKSADRRKSSAKMNESSSDDEEQYSDTYGSAG